MRELERESEEERGRVEQAELALQKAQEARDQVTRAPNHDPDAKMHATVAHVAVCFQISDWVKQVHVRMLLRLSENKKKCGRVGEGEWGEWSEFVRLSF